MKISVFGLGYVGAVSAGCLTATGHEVTGVDPASVKVDLINAGKSPVIEEGLGELIGRAEVLYGSARQLALFPDFSGETVDIGGDPAKLVSHLQGSGRQSVVLASGDPLFFSVGRDLLRNFPPESLEFIPNVSSVQYAFAKLKEPWDDAVFISAQGRGLKGTVDRIVANDKAAILTDEVHTPAVIAAELIERGRDGYAAYLCENLGMPDERIVATDVRELPGIAVSPLNVLILIKEYDASREQSVPALGIADEEFAEAGATPDADALPTADVVGSVQPPGADAVGTDPRVPRPEQPLAGA